VLTSKVIVKVGKSLATVNQAARIMRTQNRIVKKHVDFVKLAVKTKRMLIIASITKPTVDMLHMALPSERIARKRAINAQVQNLNVVKDQTNWIE